MHGACEQGAVPRTKASCADTNVTDVAANPPGTGPPGGGAGIMGVPGATDGATVGVAAGVGRQPTGETTRSRTAPSRSAARRKGSPYPPVPGSHERLSSAPTFFWSRLTTSADPGLESAVGNHGDQGQEPGCQGCGRDGRLPGSRPGGPRPQDHAAEPLSSFPPIPGRGSRLPRAGRRRCAATRGRPRPCGRRCEGATASPARAVRMSSRAERPAQAGRRAAVPAGSASQG